MSAPYYGCSIRRCANQPAGAPGHLYSVSGRYCRPATAEPPLTTLRAARAWVREQAEAEIVRNLEQHGERPFRIYRP